jgi:Zn-dependent protease with chaperone function
VLSSGALAVLDPDQLAAVLAHERAHLAGRHHLLISLTRALLASFPAVPLFTQGPGELARLAEMCADDVAARHAGRGTLVAALLAMGTERRCRLPPSPPRVARPWPACSGCWNLLGAPSAPAAAWP